MSFIYHRKKRQKKSCFSSRVKRKARSPHPGGRFHPHLRFPLPSQELPFSSFPHFRTIAGNPDILALNIQCQEVFFLHVNFYLFYLYLGFLSFPGSYRRIYSLLFIAGYSHRTSLCITWAKRPSSFSNSSSV